MAVNNNKGALTAYKNGGTVMPQENDIISWSGNGTGHVGIVAQVAFDSKSGNGFVYTVEQNASRDKGLFTQPLTRNGDGTYTVGNRMSGYNVQGWTRYGVMSTIPTHTRNTPAPKPPIKK